MRTTVRLYKLPNGRLVVPFFISQRDIDNGFNGIKPGVYLLRGAWYGKDLGNRASYGKTEGMLKSWGKSVKFAGLRDRYKETAKDSEI